MVILTERWDRHRDAQQATNRLTIKGLRNDALNVFELRAGLSETCIVTRNAGLRMIESEEKKL
jgi:hypothetical protein